MSTGAKPDARVTDHPQRVPEGGDDACRQALPATEDEGCGTNSGVGVGAGVGA